MCLPSEIRLSGMKDIFAKFPNVFLRQANSFAFVEIETGKI